MRQCNVEGMHNDFVAIFFTLMQPSHTNFTLIVLPLIPQTILAQLHSILKHGITNFAWSQVGEVSFLCKNGLVGSGMKVHIASLIYFLEDLHLVCCQSLHYYKIWMQHRNLHPMAMHFSLEKNYAFKMHFSIKFGVPKFVSWLHHPYRHALTCIRLHINFASDFVSL